MNDFNDYHPTLTLDMALNKAEMLTDIRRFFHQRGVLEVTTPILSHTGNTDVFIQSVMAIFNQQDKPRIGFLHTSPEFAMKRVLADYQVPIYQICQVFRDNEIGQNHNIEFTMLEWYRPNFSLKKLAEELSELLTIVLHRSLPFKNYRYSQVFVDKVGIHPFDTHNRTLKECARSHGITLDMGDDTQGWLDLLFSHLVEPHLGKDLPTIITDYPPATAALAKIKQDKEGYDVAQRFELYIDGIEIANAYDELSDSNALFHRFNHDNSLRKKLNLPQMPIDNKLISASRDLPPCSGIAVGIDRLFMVREKLASIDKAITIPTPQA